MTDPMAIPIISEVLSEGELDELDPELAVSVGEDPLCDVVCMLPGIEVPPLPVADT